MTNNTLIGVKEETVSSRLLNTASFSAPVAAFVVLVAALLNRFYPDLGFELIIAIAAASGFLFNAIYDLSRFLFALAKQKYRADYS